MRILEWLCALGLCDGEALFQTCHTTERLCRVISLQPSPCVERAHAAERPQCAERRGLSTRLPQHALHGYHRRAQRWTRTKSAAQR